MTLWICPWKLRPAVSDVIPRTLVEPAVLALPSIFVSALHDIIYLLHFRYLSFSIRKWSHMQCMETISHWVGWSPDWLNNTHLPPKFLLQTSFTNLNSTINTYRQYKMPNTKTLSVPHLDGITAAYQSPHPYDPRKPTIVLINAFTTSSELYRDQFANKQLTDMVNLLAIEVLGHGQTRTKREHWTFWDSAEMNLQVLEELKIEKAFVLGTSQGGWVAMRMALMRPEKVGIVNYICLIAVSAPTNIDVAYR